MTLAQLATSWRSDAETLRRRGCEEAARLLATCADELDEARSAGDDEPLSLADAAQVSGYSRAHLRRLLADGALRDVAARGAPRLRRGDLPRKPGPRRAPR